MLGRDIKALDELRGHKVVPAMSHTIYLPLLSSFQ